MNGGAVRNNPTLLLVFIGLFGVTLWAFAPWMPGVWYGDDLSNYLEFKRGTFASDLSQAVTGQYADKYRPLFQLAWLATMGSFGDNLTTHMGVNVFLHALNCVLFFVVARNLSSSLLVALAASIAFCASRFNWYQVTQVTGLLESLATVFFLLSVLGLVNWRHTVGAERRLWIPVCWAASAAAVFTHERYFPLPVVLALAPVLFRAPRLERIVLAIAFLCIPLANYLIKVAVLQLPFMVGSSGLSLLSTKMDIAAGYAGNAVSSIFGFNTGAPAWFGYQFYELPKPWIFVGVAAFISLALMIRHAWENPVVLGSMAKDWPLPFLFVLISGSLLVAPVLTIWLQQRWLVQPFVLVLLTVCWATGADRWMKLAAVALFCCSFAIDRAYAPSTSMQTMVGSAKIARQVKESFMGRESIQEPIITTLSQPECDWALLKFAIFEMYTGRKPKMICATTVENAKRLREDNSLPIFEWSRANGFQKVVEGD